MTNDALLTALVAAQLIDAAGRARFERELAAEPSTSIDAVNATTHLVDDAALTDIKSTLLKVPVYHLPSQYDAALISLIPEETARTYQVAPLAKQDTTLIVGMVHPDDSRAQEALKFIARQQRVNLGVYLISYTDLQRVLRTYSPYKNEIEAAVQSLRLKTAGSAQRTVELDSKSERAEDAPVIRIVADTLREAVERGSSDIHLEPQERALRVRFRIDGALHEVASLPHELSDAVISRVKVLSNLKIDERRVPQDGRFRSTIANREIDFRVATFPTPLGEKMAIRILDSTTGLKSFEQLGLDGKNLAGVKEAIAEPYGMVLVTGPTGSGKTTTLYALLQLLNTEDVNIVSLEDPVEYFVAGVNQSQVRPEIGYDFAAGLRQILRQDPDVIMVGEIRDRETAELAVQAALTGHIVLSTLHTNNAAGVIPRLIDMGVEPFLLPSALNIMIAQRLVGRLCEQCRIAHTPPPAVVDEIRQALQTLPAGITHPFVEPYQTYTAPGCATCRSRGITGRIAIFEVVRMTPELEQVIGSGATVTTVATEARRQGALTMRQDGILKALAGVVTVEDVLKETVDV